MRKQGNNVTTTFKVVGTDHFDWPPEECPAGEFATRAEAEANFNEHRRNKGSRVDMNDTVTRGSDLALRLRGLWRPGDLLT